MAELNVQGDVAATAVQKRRRDSVPAAELTGQAVRAAQEKKALEIVVMDMREASGLADYFVLCTGTSDLQIKAITEAVTERIKLKCGERPWHIEGLENRQWVLMDYVDLVVHVFSPDSRAFYDLQRLWRDAPAETVNGDAVELLR